MIFPVEQMLWRCRGLVTRGRKRGVHRKRRERRPLPGMLLHLDGSYHRWFQGERTNGGSQMKLGCWERCLSVKLSIDCGMVLWTHVPQA